MWVIRNYIQSNRRKVKNTEINVVLSRKHVKTVLLSNLHDNCVQAIDSSQWLHSNSPTALGLL